MNDPVTDGSDTGGPGRRTFLALLGGGLVIGVGIGYALRESTPASAAQRTLYFSSGSTVYALRASTGTILWARSYTTSGPIAIGSGNVYIAGYTGVVRA